MKYKRLYHHLIYHFSSFSQDKFCICIIVTSRRIKL